MLAWITPDHVSLRMASGNHMFIFSFLRHGLRMPRAVLLGS